MLTFILVLFCLFRVEDAGGCFILTDRYADNREAAVSVFQLHFRTNVSYLFCNNLTYSRHTGFSIEAGTHPCEVNSQSSGNSSLFQDMQMRKDEKPWNIWEYLGMGENTSGNFWEFLGIPNNSKFGGNCLWNLWELLGIAKTPMRIYGNS